MTKFKKIINAIGLPRLIICLFFGGILLLAAVNDLNMTSYIGSILKYWGMWGILVLAMVPSINCGIGPNFGVSLGIVCGLLGSLLAIELDIAGKINASVPGL
ncbi:MAG: ABC transporter permease, partial [Clostridia bacterium]|nr:ABC transporter permease [Clostridia bacterium]